MIRTENAARTLARLWVAYLAEKVEITDETEEQINQQWRSIVECCEAKARDTESRMGDTWNLSILGYQSPTWILGIQNSACV